MLARTTMSTMIPTMRHCAAFRRRGPLSIGMLVFPDAAVVLLPLLSIFIFGNA